MDDKKILELKIRGYVTPEDMGSGSDGEKLQKALELAAEADIRKVVIDRDLKPDRTIRIPAGMELKFAPGVLVDSSAEPAFVNEVSTQPEKGSWSFEDQWIFLLGEKGSRVKGSLKFYHAGNLVIEDMDIEGSLRFEFCREVRMERNTVRGGKDCALTLMRGCNNYIVQYNVFEACETAVTADASLEEGPYVIGKDTDIHELIIRDNVMHAQTAFFIGASEESGVFNVQYDHSLTEGTGVMIGHAGEQLDKKRYFNITSTEHKCGTEKLLNNEVKHCFFGE